MKLLLHPKAKARYDQIVSDPPHALLLIAPAGSGKQFLLSHLALDITKGVMSRIVTIVPEEKKKSISIDQIRELKIQLKNKYKENRVVLIPDAQLLGIDAQHAILKILEEPRPSTVFLLGVTNKFDVIETIQSRTQIWTIPEPTEQQIYEFYAEVPRVDLSKAITIAGGRMGLLSALLAEDSENSLISAIETAKTILSESTFDRLTRIDVLAKKTLDTSLLLEALLLISKAAMEGAAKANTKTLYSWHKRLDCVMQAKMLLRQNVNPKLVLTQLFIKL